MSSLLKFANLFINSQKECDAHVQNNINNQGYHRGVMFYYHSMALGYLFQLSVLYNIYLLFTTKIDIITILYHLSKIIVVSYTISISNTICHHRLISHKSWECNRIIQLILNIIGSIPSYFGALKYAAIHIVHHKVCDEEGDPYGGVRKGLSYNSRGFITDYDNYHYKQPNNKHYEMYLFDKVDFLPALLFIPAYFLLGNSISEGVIIHFLSSVIVGGFAMSGHFIGDEKTNDSKCQAMNDSVLGFLSTGESYHENHHSHPTRCNIAMESSQLDLGFQIIKLLTFLNLASYNQEKNNS